MHPMIVFFFEFQAILDIVVSFYSIFYLCFLKDPIVLLGCTLGN